MSAASGFPDQPSGVAEVSNLRSSEPKLQANEVVDQMTDFRPLRTVAPTALQCDAGLGGSAADLPFRAHGIMGRATATA